MLRFVCLAIIAVSANAGGKYSYGHVPSVAFSSQRFTFGGPSPNFGARGLGLGNVDGSINSFGGVNTFASGLHGATPAVRGAAQGAATGSALGISAGPASRVSGVAVGTGDGRAHVIGNVQPAYGYGAVPLGAGGFHGANIGNTYGYNGGFGGIGFGRPDFATFQGHTFGNNAFGVINSNLQGQIGYGTTGLVGGFHGLYRPNYWGLGGSSFTGTSQSLPYGDAVFRGQAVGAGVPLDGSVNFRNFGVGTEPFFGAGPVVGPSVVGPSVEGPSFVGPSVVGPSLVGPSVEGPSVGGPSVVGPSITIKKKVY